MHRGTTKHWLVKLYSNRSGDYINSNCTGKRFEVNKFLWSEKQNTLDLEENAFLVETGEFSRI